MKPLSLKFFFVSVCAAVSFVASDQAEAASVTYQGRKSVAIASSFARPMQCIINAIQKSGYRPRAVGCFGSRPRNRSAHPTGHACDVDQTARDVTGLNRKFSAKKQNSIAANCGAVSGCKWRHRDCGHFEQRSAPYSRAGARISKSERKYYYKNKKRKKNRKKKK